MGITLAAIHIFGINITGVSVNPARSLGPALIVGGQAISQVWMFLIVPTVAAMCAGAFFRSGVLACLPQKPVLTEVVKSKAQAA
jgi:aquaporin Z